MSNSRIGFIGAGNMASALFGGLLKQGYPPSLICAADPNSAALDSAREAGIATATDNGAVAGRCDVVVLAVKPQMLKDVLVPLQPALKQRRPLLISIVAGIDLHSLQCWAGASLPVVRCMPNTPALLGCGATGLFANEQVSAAQRETADSILGAVGTTLWLDGEEKLDAVTAVSGSGPAYYFLVMEAMIEAGRQQGLSEAEAEQLTLQTAVGAAQMARGSDVTVAELRRRVTSPGGTTERALATFAEGDLKALFARAMQDCAGRSVELARELGEN